MKILDFKNLVVRVPQAGGRDSFYGAELLSFFKYILSKLSIKRQKISNLAQSDLDVFVQDYLFCTYTSGKKRSILNTLKRTQYIKTI